MLSAANRPAERRPSGPCLLGERQEGKRSGELGLAEALNRAGAGRRGCRAEGIGETPQGTSAARPSLARARPPPVTVPVAAQETAATEAERAPPSPSRAADPPHLDLPTPLSPMIRIFRVVSTSSSILTLVRSAPSRPCLSTLHPGELPVHAHRSAAATFSSQRVFRLLKP